MKKMLLFVYDQGSLYLVVNSQISNLLLDKSIEIKDVKLFEYITEALINKKIVQIPKNIDNLTTDEVIISSSDTLESKKYTLISKIKYMINERMGHSYSYDFFNFNVTSTYLSSKGYFITSENREEMYVKIIESEDDKLIDTLEKYLNEFDKLSKYDYLYKLSEDAIKNIEDSEDENELDKIMETFLDSFR